MGAQPSWISDMEGVGTDSRVAHNEYHDSYTASHTHSQNALTKNAFMHRSEYDTFHDPSAVGADIIPEEKKIFDTAKKSRITYSEHGEGASALDRWRERKEIIEHEAILLEQAMTPLNPDSYAYFEEKDSGPPDTDTRLGGGSSVGRHGSLSVSDTVTYSSSDNYSRSLKNLNMDEQGHKLGPKKYGKPSAFGYNATVANKEHREKKRLEWEAAERLSADIAEYKKVEAAKEEEKKKANRFGSPDASVAASGSIASAQTPEGELGSLASPASQKNSHHASHTISPHSVSVAGSAAGSVRSDKEFSYTHMLEKVEQERKEQAELALKATQMALARDPSRLPKFRSRTNQAVQQKPLRKLPNSSRIMATVAEQIVLGGDHNKGLRQRPGYPMTNNELTTYAKK